MMEVDKIPFMEVITTHLNADFDAFGSMVAAKKLYPAAVVAFPGAQEKSLRDFFMESTLYILSIERAKNIDLDEVDRLIVVDTRQKSRIGRFASLTEADSVEIHIYDHHPDSDDDIKGDLEIVREVGATVTILSQLIRERGIEITSEEATLLALGLHEDTGSFTFSSTTPEDLEVAAWLLRQGASLNTVSDMMTTDLSKDQIEVLYQLLDGADVVNIGGVEVVVATATVQEYVRDLAVLVHKYRDMENPDAIFAIVRMDDRCYLVARSRVEEVNAGEIAAEFGGGGHPMAASATIKDYPLYEARDRLIALLQARVHPKQEASEIMSRPVITLGPDQKMGKASEVLSRYQVSSLPIVGESGVVGLLHREAVEKAIHHGLQDTLVEDYMDPDFVAVAPDDSIDAVVHIAVDHHHRLVPVMEGDQLLGVISRSDILEHMNLPKTRDSASPDEYPTARMRSKSVRRLIEELFPKHVSRMLRLAGEVAEKRNEDVYLVGGAVRDLLLRNPTLDIDLVVEGDGIAFASEFAAQLSGCRVRSHEKFRTAVLLFNEGFKIDVATARHEYYARPGALPTVELSSIRRDLYRRDFTMNTLAVSLNPRNLGKLIDFFGGARDIKDRIIRVLHNLAFVEDPTRILRALRFCSRFRFTVGKHTLNLMRRALKMRIFDRVEGKRLLNELVHLLDEKNPLPGIVLMADFGVFEALHPAMEFTPKVRESVESVYQVLAWWKYLYLDEKIDPWLVYFLALTSGLTGDAFSEVTTRFSLAPSKSAALIRERKAIRKVLQMFARGEIDCRSKVAQNLKGLSVEVLLFIMARSSLERTRMAIAEYVTTLRHVKPELTGKELIQMGYKPGPIFHEILNEVLAARLDGLLHSTQDERDFVKTRFPIESGADEKPMNTG